MTRAQCDSPEAPWADAVETHSAVVFFVGDRAYKLKKPLDLGFLDFSTRAARQAVCHREVDLNRRLAPDVYLGVADVTGPDGALADHLVVMRRLPASMRLSTLVADGAEVGDELRGVARQVARLHAESSHSDAADVAAGVEATRDRWTENMGTIRASTPRVFDVDLVDDVEWLANRYLDGRQTLFDERIAHGRAVDGHGDLIADDIFCLPDRPRILDCIEFDDRYRLGDGLADVAFLAMDLERLGRPDLAEQFLAEYREARNDSWPPSLAHHHIAYRAQVRARVGAIRAVQGDAEAGPRAASLLGLARQHLERGRVRLVLVGGAPGTGKTTLAGHLAAELDAVVLATDEIRKELAGIPSLQPAPADFGQGIYSREATAATYDRLLARAAVALRRGEIVIADGTWLDERWRGRARAVATCATADLVELRCSAPFDVMRRRIEERAASHHDASDATPDVARRLLACSSRWVCATEIDTDASIDRSLADARRAVS